MDCVGAGRTGCPGPPPKPPGGENPWGAGALGATGGRLPMGAGMLLGPGTPGAAPKPVGAAPGAGKAGPGAGCPGGNPLGLGAGAPSGASDFFPSRAFRSILPAAMCSSAPLISCFGVVVGGYQFGSAGHRNEALDERCSSVSDTARVGTVGQRYCFRQHGKGGPPFAR